MDSSEEDVFLCGRCKKEFYKMDEFMTHKKRKACKKKGDTDSSCGVSNLESAYSEKNTVEVVESAEDGIPADLFEETLSANDEDSNPLLTTEGIAKTSRADDVRMTNCPFCNISFKSAKELPLHFIEKHSIPEDKAPIILENFSGAPLESEVTNSKSICPALSEGKQEKIINVISKAPMTREQSETLSEMERECIEKRSLMRELGLEGSTSISRKAKYKTAKESALRCNSCGISCKSPKNLKVHLKSKGHKAKATSVRKVAKESRRNVTNIVNMDTTTSTAKDTNNSSSEDGIVDVDTIPPPADEENVTKSLKRSRRKICHICKMSFSSQNEVVRHFSTVHSQHGRGKRSRRASVKLRMNNSENEEANEEEDSDDEKDDHYSENNRRNRKEPGECDHCGKLVPAKAYTVHVRRCNNKLKYQCTLCKHQSRERYDFNIHIDHHKVWWNMSAELASGATSEETPEVVAVIMPKEKSSDQDRRDPLFVEELEDTTLSEADLAALGLMPRSKLDDQKKKQSLQLQEHTYASQEDQEEEKHPEEVLLADDIGREDCLEGGSNDQKSGGSRLKCHPCNKWYHRSKLPDHMLKMHNMRKVFQCRDVNCLNVFDNLNEFITHISDHSSQPMFQCGCTSCKKGNPVEGEIDYSAAIKRLKMKNYYKTLVFKCSTCWARFPSQTSLDKHLETDTHHYPCDICGKLQSSRSQFRSHMMSHQQTHKFLCEHCGKGFRVQRDLLKHVASHSGDKPFACSQCDKRFVFKAKLDRHFTTVHSLIKPYACTEEGCDKAFTRKDKLKDHMYTHSPSPPFKCNFCAKGFYRKDNLRDHEVYHTRQYKYKCNKCNKGFMRPKALSQHFAADHPVHANSGKTLPETLNQSDAPTDTITQIGSSTTVGPQSSKQSDFAGFSSLQIDQQVLNKVAFSPASGFTVLPHLQRGTEMSRSGALISDVNQSVNALVQMLPQGSNDVSVQSSQGLSIPIQSPSAASSQFKSTQEKLEQVTRQIQVVTQQLLVQQFGGEL
ncbi:uncharacterized protein [Apostichopus japonicus]|uniref:uncharacterized protein isoform X2 n=1 Tax=Stichopus japonicus TaxID=307972 RepID=UPI003AB5F6C0